MTITDVINVGINNAVAATEETLYTVPTGKNFLGRIRAANRDVASAFSVIAAPAGAATAATMYKAYQTPIDDHDNWERTFVFPADTVIRVVGQALNFTFSINGYLFTV